MRSPFPVTCSLPARKTGPVDVALGAKRRSGPCAHGRSTGDHLRLPGRGTPVDRAPRGSPPCERQDPIWYRTGGTQIGRDGCRIPMPWKRGAHSLGFSEQAWKRSLARPDPRPTKE